MNLSSLAGVLQVLNHFRGKNRILGGQLPGSGGSQMDVEELDEPPLLDVFPGGDASTCTFLWHKSLEQLSNIKAFKGSNSKIKVKQSNTQSTKIFINQRSMVKNNWSFIHIVHIYIYAYFMMLFLLQGFFPFFPAAFVHFRLDYRL